MELISIRILCLAVNIYEKYIHVNLFNGSKFHRPLFYP
jgi:hypothetical protein